MIQNIQHLMDAYHAWLRDRSTLRRIDDWVEITTPYMDRHNDYVQICAQRANGGFTLTDDGYTLTDLEQSGCKLDGRGEGTTDAGHSAREPRLWRQARRLDRRLAGAGRPVGRRFGDLHPATLRDPIHFDY